MCVRVCVCARCVRVCVFYILYIYIYIYTGCCRNGWPNFKSIFHSLDSETLPFQVINIFYLLHLETWTTELNWKNSIINTICLLLNLEFSNSSNHTCSAIVGVRMFLFRSRLTVLDTKDPVSSMDQTKCIPPLAHCFFY